MTEEKATYQFTRTSGHRPRRQASDIAAPGSGGNRFKRVYDRAIIFEWIKKYKTDSGGDSPTMSEIGMAFGISSKSVVKSILEDLEDNGKIRLSGNRKARSIYVFGGQWTFDPKLAMEGVKL